jgi:hypothetical protein
MVASEMKTLRQMRPFLVYLCLAVILLAAVTHPGGSLPAILLAVFWFFITMAIGAPGHCTEESFTIQPYPILPVCSPRPPPLQ